MTADQPMIIERADDHMRRFPSHDLVAALRDEILRLRAPVEITDELVLRCIGAFNGALGGMTRAPHLLNEPLDRDGMRAALAAALNQGKA